MSEVRVIQFGFYRNNEFGSFMVRNLSRNGLMITILDSYGNFHKASYLRFLDSTEIEREAFDELYRTHTCKPNYMIKHLSNH